MSNLLVFLSFSITNVYIIYFSESEIRKHEDTVKLMLKSHLHKTTIKGVKGCSAFAGFKYFNLHWSFAFDYMHTVCLGNVKHLTGLWSGDKKIFFNDKTSVAAINNTMENSRVPGAFTRPLKNILESHEWKASQCRDFLLYKGPAALKGNLSTVFYKNFVKLSQAVYIFLKDSITETEFMIGSNLIFEFLMEFQLLYGISNMRFNVHLLTHLPLSLLYNGPLWCSSLYSYESKNHFLNLLINGTHNIVQESANKISIQQQKFIGVNLNRKDKHYCYEGKIFTNSPAKNVEYNNAYGLNLAGYSEIRNIIYKSCFYEKFIEKKKTDDSFIEINNELFQIIKILIKEESVYLLIKSQFVVEKRENHINFLKSKNYCEFKIVRVTDYLKKAVFIESSLNYFVFPNTIEFD